MLLRIASLGIMAVAALYGAEATGLVAKRQYLPSLPRLEASTPADWMAAGGWLVSTTACLFEGHSLSTCTDDAA